MPVDEAAPVVSVLVLSYQTRDLTLACLAALQAETPRYAREVLVLDNASQDGSAAAIATAFPDLRLERWPENVGYACGNNVLAHLARGRYLCLLGSDTEVRPGAIDALVEFLEAHPGHGAAAPRLVNPDGSLQAACMRWPTLGVALVYDMCWRSWPLLRRIDDRYHYRDFDHRHDRDVDQPPGTCFVVRRDLWRALGGFDESLWLFYNDVDLCRRLWQGGHAIRYLADPEVMHHLGASTRRFGSRVAFWARDRLAYYRKHYGWLGWHLVRLVLRLRGWQEWWVLGRRHADRGVRAAARRELRDVLRQVLS